MCTQLKYLYQLLWCESKVKSLLPCIKVMNTCRLHALFFPPLSRKKNQYWKRNDHWGKLSLLNWHPNQPGRAVKAVTRRLTSFRQNRYHISSEWQTESHTPGCGNRFWSVSKPQLSCAFSCPANHSTWDSTIFFLKRTLSESWITCDIMKHCQIQEDKSSNLYQRRERWM